VHLLSNAGLPNAFGGTTRPRAEMAATLAEFAANGGSNLLGGCAVPAPPTFQGHPAAVKGLAHARSRLPLAGAPSQRPEPLTDCLIAEAVSIR